VIAPIARNSSYAVITVFLETPSFAAKTLVDGNSAARASLPCSIARWIASQICSAIGTPDRRRNSRPGIPQLVLFFTNWIFPFLRR